MTKATAPASVSPPATPADLPTMRRQSDELAAEIARQEDAKARLEQRVRRGLSDDEVQAMAQRILAGDDTAGGEGWRELGRIEERLGVLGKARDALDSAIIRLEREEDIEKRFVPAYQAAEAFIPKIAAALDQLEDVLREAWAAAVAAEQATADVDFWTFEHKLGVRLPFNPERMRLLKFFTKDFIPAGTSPLTPPDKVRDALFGAPTRVEQWRELAAELGVQLARPAVWPDRSKGYVKAPKRSILGTAWVRMRTTLADAIAPAFVGDILKVTGDQAADLIDGGYALPATEKEANERMRIFRTRPGKDSLSEAEAGRSLPVKEHLVAATAPIRKVDDSDWTAE